MNRFYGTNKFNVQFDLIAIEMVWQKAKPVGLYNPDKLREDIFRHLIKREDYGNIDSNFGWEIDHIMPVAKGGSDEISNLQPLYWKTNREKSDEYPYNPFFKGLPRKK